MNREPIPPQASRQDALGQLRRERWLAADAGETARVAEIDERIAQLSAASAPRPPRRETAAAQRPEAEKTAAKAAAGKAAAGRPTTKGKNSVAEP